MQLFLLLVQNGLTMPFFFLSKKKKSFNYNFVFKGSRCCYAYRYDYNDLFNYFTQQHVVQIYIIFNYKFNIFIDYLFISFVLNMTKCMIHCDSYQKWLIVICPFPKNTLEIDTKSFSFEIQYNV